MSEPGDRTRIIRRQPSGPIPRPEEPRTGIIRRAPTGPIPAMPDDRTTNIPRPPADEAPTGLIRRATPVSVPARPGAVDISTGRTAIAAGAVSIISGWATGVVATDLITGWWGTDRLFCVAVGFLTLLFAVTSIAGVIALLLRRSSRPLPDRVRRRHRAADVRQCVRRRSANPVGGVLDFSTRAWTCASW